MTAIAQILKDCRTGMEKSVESARHQFNTIRSGKASGAMLDSVKVEIYGTEMALNQCATVSAPEPRLLLVTPFDKTQAKAIEKAIRDANLGLDPAHQAGVIRVPLPAMTEERRKELAKVLHKYAEEGTIAVRHQRTHAREALKALEGVSEDAVKLAEKDLQKVHDEFIAKLDQALKVKEKEMMEV
ncbi:MAG: ribosome recycling factor [Gemmatimonadaceae bacterium]|nr:ribosome recycling factor [Gemmatimonadaceae bacterium]